MSRCDDHTTFSLSHVIYLLYYNGVANFFLVTTLAYLISWRSEGQ